MSLTRHSLINEKYESILKDFILTQEYVSISQNSLEVYSPAYLKLFLAICDEFETYISEFVRMFNSSAKKATIMDFIRIAEKSCNCLFYKSVLLKKTKWIIYPWERDSSNASSFSWWRQYNEIKHDRLLVNDAGISNTTNATLKNILYAFAALSLVKSCVEEGICPNMLNKIMHQDDSLKFVYCNYGSKNEFLSLLKDEDFYINHAMYFLNTNSKITNDEYWLFLKSKNQ